MRPDIEAIEKRLNKVEADRWVLGDWWSICHLPHLPHGQGKCKYDDEFHQGRDIVLPDKPVKILNLDTDWGDSMPPDAVQFTLNAGRDIVALLAYIKELEAKLKAVGVEVG